MKPLPHLPSAASSRSLVGSTALSARLDPEDLRGIITAYHRCCTELVEQPGDYAAFNSNQPCDTTS
jgi:hypothetical protein